MVSQRDIDFAFMLGQLNVHISPVIQEALSQSRNITSLYSHQAESINALCSGKNVIVTTSTARLVTIAGLCIIFNIWFVSSGKSLIYQIPVLEALLEDKDSKAMYIFPTKALAQDQLRSLQDIISVCTGLEDTMVTNLNAFIYRFLVPNFASDIHFWWRYPQRSTQIYPWHSKHHFHESRYAASQRPSQQLPMAAVFTESEIRCSGRTSYLQWPFRF